MEKKDVRIQLVISPSEVEALDEWRAEQRIWSRSEAIRRLVADGVKKKLASNDGKPASE
jgi:metal-responsive CopG/Arc/MetJ family transcriptional regulator